MSSPVKWGLILGISVGVLGFVFAAAGLHENPPMASLFVLLAIVINVTVIILALRETRDEATWARQLVNGVIIGAIGAVIIFTSSFVMTTVVFPEYYDEMLAGMAEMLAASGLPKAEAEAQLAALQEVTPAASAAQGAFGTIITSIVVAAIGGFFLRKPGGEVAPS